jgi:uncharacterized protein involved in exopolysaccharide biosynthesis
MGFIQIIQLLLRNKKWVLVFPILAASLVFYLTRNIPSTYSAEMVIYTGIASGYNIGNDMEGKTDFHMVNSKFDNLIQTITSKETNKEVALRLLAEMINKLASLNRLILKTGNQRFEWLADSSKTKNLRGATVELTYNSLLQEIHKGSNNPYFELVFGKYDNPFNIKTIRDIKATRIGFSDMVKVEYTANDAYITKRTLDILSEVFLKKHRNMQIGEAYSVVKYFQEQTALSLAKLQQAEMALKSFRTTNRVINYYEQTKYIADQKEDFDMRESALLMDLQGYQNAYKKIESKLDNRALLQLKSEEVVKKRNELTAKLNALDLAGVKGNDKTGNSEKEIADMKQKLKSSIQDLYNINNSTEGVPSKMLLDEWLDLTVNLEESKAKLAALQKHKSEFERIYDQYAPMGSDLNKLERDVDVTEKEYLNLLHNLNQAKLRERNLQVTQNVSVVDPADLPVVPNTSKKFLLVIAAALSCFILVVILLILKEFMNDSIANPARLQKLSGLKTATAFAAEIDGDAANSEIMNDLSYERWMLRFMDLKNQHQNEPVNIMVLPFHKSITNGESLVNEMVERLNQNGHNWKAVTPQTASFDGASDQIIIVNHANHELLNQALLKASSMVYLLVDAEGKMGEYDEQLLEGWKTLNTPIQTILTNAKRYQLEKYFGEVPMKRSAIRKKIKNILTRYSK